MKVSELIKEMQRANVDYALALKVKLEAQKNFDEAFEKREAAFNNLEKEIGKANAMITYNQRYKKGRS